jgi:hypothetical protein
MNMEQHKAQIGSGPSHPQQQQRQRVDGLKDINQRRQSASALGSATTSKCERLESRTRVTHAQRASTVDPHPPANRQRPREVGIKQRQQATAQADAQPPANRERFGQSDPAPPAPKSVESASTPGQPQGAIQARTSQSSSVRPTRRASSSSPSSSMFLKPVV